MVKEKKKLKLAKIFDHKTERKKNLQANDDGKKFKNDVINWRKMSFGKVYAAVPLEKGK